MLLLADTPPVAPSVAAVMARARGENFPVASRVLPRRARTHLLALYGFARLVDELGDGEARPPSGWRRCSGCRRNWSAPTRAAHGTRCWSGCSRRYARARCRASRSCA